MTGALHLYFDFRWVKNKGSPFFSFIGIFGLRRVQIPCDVRLPYVVGIEAGEAEADRAAPPLKAEPGLKTLAPNQIHRNIPCYHDRFILAMLCFHIIPFLANFRE